MGRRLPPFSSSDTDVVLFLFFDSFLLWTDVLIADGWTTTAAREQPLKET
jgi:hypothetical protein